MVTETFIVIRESDLIAAGYSAASNGAFTTVGSTFTYSAALMPYHTVEVTDNGADQTTLSGDTNPDNTDGGANTDNEGADGETATLYDPDGNPVGTQGGRVASDRAGILEGSDGSIIEIYEVELFDDIDVYAFSAPLVEGVTYTSISNQPRDQNLAYSQMVCFAWDTGILTPRGEVPVQSLKVGDLVSTMDDGDQPICWLGNHDLSGPHLAGAGALGPVCIARNTLGHHRDLVVSPQHRILIGSAFLGQPSGALVAARLLAEEWGQGCRILHGAAPRRFVHFLLPHHSLVWANGVVSESFYPGPQALRTLTSESLASLKKAIAVLRGAEDSIADLSQAYGPMARPTLGRAALRRALKTREIAPRFALCT